MQDDHSVVEQDPTGIVSALDAEFIDTLLGQSRFHLLRDIFSLNSGGGTRDDEVVTNCGQFFDVEHEYIVGFHFVGGLRRDFCYF